MRSGNVGAPENRPNVRANDPEAIRNATPEDKAAGRKPEEFYDNSIIQELVNEGFVESLKKKTR